MTFISLIIQACSTKACSSKAILGVSQKKQELLLNVKKLLSHLINLKIY